MLILLRTTYQQKIFKIQDTFRDAQYTANKKYANKDIIQSILINTVKHYYNCST